MIIFYDYILPFFNKLDQSTNPTFYRDYLVKVDRALLVIVSIKFVWWKYVYMTQPTYIF